MHAELEQRLRFCGNLPSLPAVALQVIDLANNPDVQLSDLAKVIELDPALVTKLFRAANSPLYGMRRQATNLRQVLNLLGLQGTLALALGFSLISSSQTARAVPLDIEQFWRRSLLAGTACRMLGEQLGIKNPEELFLAGLLRGIGILALALMMPDQYGILLNEAAVPQAKGPALLDYWRLAELEQDRLQADHSEVGAWLLRHWKLPIDLCCAAAGSLDPTHANAPESLQPLVKCVALAVRIADIWIRPDAWRNSPQIAEQAQQWFGLNEDDYLAVLEGIGEKFPEIANLFQIRSLDTFEVAGIHDQAREALAFRSAQRQAAAVIPAPPPRSAPVEVAFEVAGIHDQTREALAFRSVQRQSAAAIPAPLSRPAPVEVAASPRFSSTTGSRLDRQYTFDALTGLFNRQYLNDSLRQELAHARTHHWPLSVALVDLDGFKKTNEVHGNAVGDQLLIALGGQLGRNLRRQDLVARYGGDEFALLLPASGLKVARPLFDRILTLIREWRPERGSRHNARLSVSIGLVVYPETGPTEGDSADQLLQAAEHALKQAKADGGDRLAVYGE